MNDNDQSISDQVKRGFTPFPEQNEAGVDLTLLRANLKLTPLERARKAERMRQDVLRLHHLAGVTRRDSFADS